MSAYWVNNNNIIANNKKMKANKRLTKQEATAKSKTFDASLNIYVSDRNRPQQDQSNIWSLIKLADCSFRFFATKCGKALQKAAAVERSE